MRFSKLHFIKYGHFDFHEMEFQRDDAMDFQLVYGPNEAGKSTTMAAITALLFGFPTKDKYDFRSNRVLMRVGAEIENAAQKLQCRRRATNALLNFEEQSIDDAPLVNMLGGQKADSFNRMFSLNHTGLREGGQAIVAARDDVGQAIFAAGSGLSSVAALLAKLDEQSRDIWAPTKAAARSYYAAKENHDDAASRLKAAQTKPESWEKLRQLVEKLDGDMTSARDRRRVLSARRIEIERQRRTLPRSVDRKAAIEALAGLADVPRLPTDTKNRVDVIEADLLSLNTELRIATGQVAEAKASIEAVVINESLLELAGEFERLRDRKGAIEKGEADAPSLQSKVEACKGRLVPLIRDLGWSFENIYQVEERLPSRIVQTQVEDLLSRISTNETVLKAARDFERNCREDADKLREEGAPSLEDVPFEAIRAQIKAANGKGNVDDGVATARRTQQSKQRILQIALAKLVPWTGSIENLERLSVPTADQARVADQAIDDAQKVIDVLELSLGEKAKMIRQEEFDKNQLLATSNAVSVEKLTSLRSDRDGIWASLRGQILSESPISRPATEVSRYDDLISSADTLADRRFDGATNSAALALRIQNLTRLQFDKAAQEQDLAVARSALNVAEQAWRNSLALSGLVLSTAEYPAWLANRSEALAAALAAREAESALAEESTTREEVRNSFMHALTAAQVIYIEGAPADVLRQLADDFVRNFEDRQKLRLQRQGQLIAADATVKRAKEKALNAEQDHGELAREFGEVPALLGFEQEASPDTIRLRSKLFGEIRTLLDEINGYIQRIAAIEGDTKSFYASVLELAQSVEFEGPKSDEPAALLAQMIAAVGVAQVQQQARLGLEKQLNTAEMKKSAAQAKIEATNSALAPILAAAGAPDTEAFRLIQERAQARDKFEADLAKIDKDILTAEPGKKLEPLLAEVEGMEMEQLVQELDKTEVDLTDLDMNIESVAAQYATSKADFDKLNDRPDAIQAASDQVQALAEMEAQAEAYVGLRAEVAILRYAIERYRKEKQGPLLRRASELFSKLTLGRYAQLLVDPNAQKPRLCGVRAATEEVVGIEGMSEGTVDQLYLSLRLAAVENIVAGGLKMPFLADDLFINYDDDRSKAGFQALGELARHTQVIFFTHHEHLLGVAQAALTPAKAHVCRLSG